MELSRRQILQHTGLLFAPMSVSRTISSSGESLCGEDSSLPRPEPPEETPSDVHNEEYGALGLSPDQKCWVFPIKPSGSSVDNPEQMIVEYEVRTEDGVSPPDILVLSGQGLDYYDTQVNDPLIKVKEWCTHEILGRDISLPCSAGDIEFNPNDGGVVWEEGHDTVDLYSAQCLNTAPYRSPVGKSKTIPAGHYYVVFDRTDKVFDRAGEDEVTADVSIRARHPPDPKEIEETATDEVNAVYSGLPEDRSRLIRVSRSMAADICTDIEAPDTDDLVKTAPRASQLASTANALLAILERSLGYQPVFAEQISGMTTTWTRWGMSAIPVAHSVNRLHDDACALERANPEQVADHVEDFLLSIGILVGDLVLLKYGAGTRLAYSLTRAAHRYLLGFLGRVLGLRTYLVLLREVFNLTRSGITEALSQIKEMTERIVEETSFLSKDDDSISEINSMNSRDDLYSLDQFDLGLPDLYPLNDCKPLL